MKASPVFFIGLIIYIVVALAGIIGMQFPGFVMTLAFIILILGILHTIVLKMKENGSF